MSKTARDLEKIAGIPFNSKKSFTYKNNPHPVCPVSVNTYKTGKHGSAKSTLLLKQFFTDRRYQDITDSDQVFTPMFENPNYFLVSGFVTALDDQCITVLTLNYEQLKICRPKDLDVAVQDDIYVHGFVVEKNNYYKIRNLLRGQTVINWC